MKRTTHAYKFLLSILIIALGGILAYGLSLYNNFTFDDHYAILENPSLHNISLLKYLFTHHYFSMSHEASYRPLITLLNFIEYRFFAANPTGYHAVNLVLHILCSVVTLIVVRKIASARIAFFTGLLHAIHPALSETVVSVSFAEDMLCHIFLLLTMLAVLKAVDARKTLQKTVWSTTMCVFFSSALLSKETALFLPIFLICILFLTTPKKRTKSVYLVTVELTLLSLLFALIRFATHANPAAQSLNTVNSFSQWFGLFTYMPDYLKTYFLPIQLSIIHTVKTIPPRSFFALMFCAAVTVMMIVFFIYTLRKKRLYALALGWFVMGLLPVAGIIPLKFPFAERYLYIPSLGLSVICAGYLAQFLIKFKSRKRIFYIGYLALFSVLILLSTMRTSDWKTDFSLWKATYRTTPNSPVVLYSLGKVFQDTNQLDKAEKAYRRAIFLNADYLAPYMNLAVIYIDRKQYEQALAVNNEILKRNPNAVIAHFNNAIIYHELKNDEMELLSYLKAMESDPYFIQTYGNLASYYMRRDRVEKALKILQRGITSNRSWIEGYHRFYDYALKSDKRPMAENILKQGIADNPSSKELRLLYLKLKQEN